jgi:hypothetical protein
MSKRKFNNEVNEINELLKNLRVSNNKKNNESPVSKKKKSGSSPVSSKKMSRSLSPDSSPPTEANKNTARKFRVSLTKIVNGKRVNKTKKELLRDIAYQKQYIQRQKNFCKRLPLNKYKYIGENIYYNFRNEYAENITSKLNDYGKNLKSLDNEARRNYGN